MTDAELSNVWQALATLYGAQDSLEYGNWLGNVKETKELVNHAEEHLRKAIALSWASHERIAVVMLQPCTLTGEVHQEAKTP